MFTLQEQTQKKYKVSDALKQARDVLNLKGVNEMCVNALGRRHLHGHEQHITLEEMSDLIETIVDESLYYSTHRFLRRA